MHRDLIENLCVWKEAKKRKPLLLQGVRQVGKTYLLQKFGRQSFQQTHYLNFEDDEEVAILFDRNLDPHRIVSELQFHLGTTITPQQDLVIFDEIQACPRALTSLKYFQEKMPELPLCAAGSLLGVHLNEEEGSFPVGKVDMLHMYPLSFYEFLRAIQDEKSVEFLRTFHVHKEIPEVVHRHLWDRLKWYFVVGGLPEVVQTFVDEQANLFEAFHAVRVKQHELIVGYLADIAKHAGKANAMHIERVWRAVPDQLAKSQDESSHRFRFKGAVKGIDRYSRLANAIDWLEAADLIIKIKIANSGQIPFSAYTEENTFKLLLFDIGILGAMSDLSPKAILDYDYGSYKGYFAENYVAQEFLFTGARTLYSWQEGRSEVEFLRENEGKVVPVEVKSGWVTKAKSLWKFRQKYSPDYSIILSANPLSIPASIPASTRGEVHRYPLYLAGFVEKNS